MLGKSHFGVFGAMVIALSLSSCGGSSESTAAKPVVRPVKIITIGEAGTTKVSQFPAVIGASRLSELSFQVGGMLQDFPVEQSQRLKRGDLIAKLDQSDFKSSLDSAKAQFDSAEAEYQRAVRLAEQDAIAGNVLEQRKAQFDVSKAQLDQAEKAFADTVIRAPFNGVVAQKQVKALQSISPGAVVVNFMSDDSLEATVDLPASFLANIPKDESGKSDRQAFVILNTAPNQLIEAEFKGASLIADTTSQTYAVTFEFRPPSNFLVLPGMNATLELRLDRQSTSPRVAVPLDAILSDDVDRYVWIIDEESMTVSKRAVTIESGVGSAVIVTAGLDKNDKIAGAGSAYLFEGMKVREWK